ncbi:cyclin-U1-1 [Phoenix dactylifera]|uniref:Cyclin n=1 Tax=Phoenix dactylifera TaxID=42345 RepID=A0A8B8ZWG6_PHODC|nr:cyclin-U1-1 [Phoenix dactylifera]
MESGSETDEAETAPPRVLAVLTQVLERLVARNDRIGPAAERWPEKAEEGWQRRRRDLAAFLGPRPPSISVGKYLERIHRYTGCSPSCFVVGFVYIDRAVHRNPGSLVVSLNVHRLILTSVLIASKVLDDMHHNNAFFARVGGVSNIELNRLELELLFLLDFRVMVSSRVFESYCLHLEKKMMWSMTNQKITRAIFDDPQDNEAKGSVNGSRQSSLSPPHHSID